MKCKNCSSVRVIKEGFVHIPITVVGLQSLEESLSKHFILTETLEGDNKYHCGSCDQLVDAVRSCRLKHLPPILSMGEFAGQVSGYSDVSSLSTDEVPVRFREK